VIGEGRMIQFIYLFIHSIMICFQKLTLWHWMIWWLANKELEKYVEESGLA